LHLFIDIYCSSLHFGTKPSYDGTQYAGNNDGIQKFYGDCSAYESDESRVRYTVHIYFLRSFASVLRSVLM